MYGDCLKPVQPSLHIFHALARQVNPNPICIRDLIPGAADCCNLCTFSYGQLVENPELEIMRQVVEVCYLQIGHCTDCHCIQHALDK